MDSNSGDCRKNKRKEDTVMRLIATLIQKLTKHMGIAACGAASQWGGYQTKEPKNIFKK